MELVQTVTAVLTGSPGSTSAVGADFGHQPVPEGQVLASVL